MEYVEVSQDLIGNLPKALILYISYHRSRRFLGRINTQRPALGFIY